MGSDEDMNNGDMGSKRELPPLGEPASKAGGKEVEKGMKASNKIVVIGAAVFAVIVFVVVAVVVMSFSGNSNDSIPSESEVVSSEVSEEIDLSGLSPLLPSQRGVVPMASDDQVFLDVPDASVDAETVVSELQYEQLSGVLSDLKKMDERLNGFDGSVFNLSEQVVLGRSQLLDEVKRGEMDSERIAVLEKSVATLVKEVKRLTWLARQKKVAKKADRKNNAIKVRGFFVWQYRPGVEIEHDGVFERFYEGDVLNGMRLVKIDMSLEQVVFSRKGKQVVLKLEEG